MNNKPKRRLTLKLDEEVIRAAKAISAQQGVSVSHLVEGFIMGFSTLTMQKEKTKN